MDIHLVLLGCVGGDIVGFLSFGGMRLLCCMFNTHICQALYLFDMIQTIQSLVHYLCGP